MSLMELWPGLMLKGTCVSLHLQSKKSIQVLASAQDGSLNSCAVTCLIQVLDARDPLGCRCVDVERYVRQISPAKRIVLLLNKMGACA